MEQKSQLWIGTITAVILGGAVIAVAARAPEIVPKEAKEAKAAKEAEIRAAEQAAGSANTAPSSEADGVKKPLSEKLEDSEGVIKPPQGIDPEIRKPPPVGGAMKLIIPPGELGGDPTVHPQ